LGSIIRDVQLGLEDPARRHRLILFPWIGVALLACILSGGRGPSDESTVNLWEALLAVPLEVAAALGFIEIAERRVSNETALAAGLWALASTGWSYWPWSTSEGSVPPTEAGPFGWVPGKPLMVAILLALVGLALVRLTRRDEALRRRVLAGLLGAIVLAHCWWGTRLPRDSGASHRDLQDLRAGLTQPAHVDHLTFVALNRSGQSSSAEPPARLIYGLISQWPQASFEFADSWDAATSVYPSANGRDSSGATLLVAWSQRGAGRGLAPHTTLKLAVPPFLFEDLDVAVYVRDKSTGGDGL
jgi:hypothetical protein